MIRGTVVTTIRNEPNSRLVLIKCDTNGNEYVLQNLEIDVQGITTHNSVKLLKHEFIDLTRIALDEFGLREDKGGKPE